MPSYKQSLLHTLRDRRLDQERQAERVFGEATAAQRRAEDEAAQLEAHVTEARAARTAARGIEVASGRVSEAQAHQRYGARLDGELKRAIEAVARHRAGPLAGAIAAREAARLGHLSSRQRREVVDKAIARREAAAKRQTERRADAELDDRNPRKDR